MSTSQIVGYAFLFCGLLDMVLSIHILPAIMERKDTPQAQIKWVKIGLTISGLVFILLGILAFQKVLPLE